MPIDATQPKINSDSAKNQVRREFQSQPVIATAMTIIQAEEDMYIDDLRVSVRVVGSTDTNNLIFGTAGPGVAAGSQTAVTNALNVGDVAGIAANTVTPVVFTSDNDNAIFLPAGHRLTATLTDTTALAGLHVSGRFRYNRV